ncbi:MAG: RNA polymerase sigma factor [Dehalococcoidia bacterium]
MGESSSELARRGLFSPVVRTDADSERIRALREREPAAWTAFFEEQKDVVFRSAFSMVGERELAEDITGQVFLEAIEGIRRFRDRAPHLRRGFLPSRVTAASMPCESAVASNAPASRRWRLQPSPLRPHWRLSGN